MPTKKVTVVTQEEIKEAVPTIVEEQKVQKKKADPTKRIMTYIQKNLEGVEDLSNEGKVLKSLHDAYSSKNVKKTSTRKPKFEKGSEEARNHMQAIREMKDKKSQEAKNTQLIG